MSLTVGELCAGYNGLGKAVEEVFGAEPAWFFEFESAPSKILAHHYPDVPNYGDMTAVDWSQIEPVDIISGGTPCQDLSAAGRRGGMTEGTRSNLWVQMREAVHTIKPKIVFWENVRGAYSACAHSELEPCPRCVGKAGSHKPVLRALGRVLGDLSDEGYDCFWYGLPASDVGAPHGRFRVFVLGVRRDVAPDTLRSGSRGRAIIACNGSGAGTDSPTHWTDDRLDESGAVGTAALADARGLGGDQGNVSSPRHSPGTGASSVALERSGKLTPNPGSEAGQFGTGLRESRPAGKRGGRFANADGKTLPDATSNGRDEGRAESAGVERGSDAPIGGDTSVADAIRSGRDRRPRAEGRQEIQRAATERSGEGVDWGEYEPAIRRWEQALGRSAPAPTEPTGRNGNHRLAPRFTEWMMGQPDGWITDPAIGLTRNEQLKACGNGVVTQQAVAAARYMLAVWRAQMERTAA